MKHPETHCIADPSTQLPCPPESPSLSPAVSVSIYRVSLVKDESVSFGQANLGNSRQAHALIQNLILTRGQPDREQFVVAMLNVKNDLIGLNIVSVGSLSAATVSPREVLKPAILSNSAGLILSHNHPSGDLQPSADDIAITRKIIHAAEVVGIHVHEHLIIDMESDRYFSFADQGLIKKVYDERTLRQPSQFQREPFASLAGDFFVP